MTARQVETSGLTHRDNAVGAGKEPAVRRPVQGPAQPVARHADVAIHDGDRKAKKTLGEHAVLECVGAVGLDNIGPRSFQETSKPQQPGCPQPRKVTVRDIDGWHPVGGQRRIGRAVERNQRNVLPSSLQTLRQLQGEDLGAT